MTPQEVLLLLNFARTLVIIGAMWWLIFTPHRAREMKKFCLTIFFIVLALNLWASAISMLILKVKLW